MPKEFIPYSYYDFINDLKVEIALIEQEFPSGPKYGDVQIVEGVPVGPSSYVSVESGGPGIELLIKRMTQYPRPMKFQWPDKTCTAYWGKVLFYGFPETKKSKPISIYPLDENRATDSERDEKPKSSGHSSIGMDYLREQLRGMYSETDTVRFSTHARIGTSVFPSTISVRVFENSQVWDISQRFMHMPEPKSIHHLTNVDGPRIEIRWDYIEFERAAARRTQHEKTDLKLGTFTGRAIGEPYVREVPGRYVYRDTHLVRVDTPEIPKDADLPPLEFLDMDFSDMDFSDIEARVAALVFDDGICTDATRREGLSPVFAMPYGTTNPGHTPNWIEKRWVDPARDAEDAVPTIPNPFHFKQGQPLMEIPVGREWLEAYGKAKTKIVKAFRIDRKDVT